MAFPVVESTTQSTQTGGTTLQVDMPAVRPDGEVYLALCFKDDDPDWTGVPANWSEIHTDQEGGAVRYHGWYWTGDSEPAFYTLTQDSEASSALVVRISGADASNPIDVNALISGSGANASSPGATTLSDEALVFHVAAVDRRSVTAPATSILSGSTGSGGNAVGHGVSHENGPATPGATGTAAFTHTSDQWITATIAIRAMVDLTLDGVSGDLNFSTSAPLAGINWVLTPPAADLTLSTAQASMDFLLVTTGELALSTTAPLAGVNFVITPPAGALALGPVAPTLLTDRGPPAADLGFSTQAPSVELVFNHIPPSADLVFSPAAASLGLTLDEPAQADLLLSGSAPAVAFSRFITVPAADLACDAQAGFMDLGISPSQTDLAFSTEAPALTATTDVEITVPQGNLVCDSVAAQIDPTGSIDVSKANAYALLAPSERLYATKVNAYTMQAPDNITSMHVSKVVAYALLVPATVPPGAQLTLTGHAPSCQVGIVVEAGQLTFTSGEPGQDYVLTIPAGDLTCDTTAPGMLAYGDIDCGLVPETWSDAKC